MFPLTVLLSSFAVFSLAGRWVAWLSPWPLALRAALALMFLATASAHWGSRRADLIEMVPDVFPDPGLIVTLTGVAEIVGAIGLLIPATAPYAAAGLVVLLLAMFPANVRAAVEGLSIGGSAATPLVPRTILQLIFIAACLAAGRRTTASEVSPESRWHATVVNAERLPGTVDR